MLSLRFSQVALLYDNEVIDLREILSLQLYISQFYQETTLPYDNEAIASSILFKFYPEMALPDHDKEDMSARRL